MVTEHTWWILMELHPKEHDMTGQEVLEILRKEKRKLQKEYHIAHLGLFGSYAKGTSHPQSDVDIVYGMMDGSRMGLAELVAFEAAVASMIGHISVDLVNEKYLDPAIKMDIQHTIIYV